MLALLRNWHKNVSWKLGYLRGRKRLPWKSPWWADKMVHSLGYMQGKGVELSPLTESNAKHDGSPR
jgi:hypothetical protein